MDWHWYNKNSILPPFPLIDLIYLRGFTFNTETDLSRSAPWWILRILGNHWGCSYSLVNITFNRREISRNSPVFSSTGIKIARRPSSSSLFRIKIGFRADGRIFLSISRVLPDVFSDDAFAEPIVQCNGLVSWPISATPNLIYSLVHVPLSPLSAF